MGALLLIGVLFVLIGIAILIGGIVTDGNRLADAMTCGHGSKLRFKSKRLTRSSGEVDHGTIDSRAAWVEDSAHQIDDRARCRHSAPGLPHLLHGLYGAANQNGDSDQDEKHTNK